MLTSCGGQCQTAALKIVALLRSGCASCMNRPSFNSRVSRLFTTLAPPHPPTPPCFPSWSHLAPRLLLLPLPPPLALLRSCVRGLIIHGVHPSAAVTSRKRWGERGEGKGKPAHRKTMSVVMPGIWSVKLAPRIPATQHPLQHPSKVCSLTRCTSRCRSASGRRRARARGAGGAAPRPPRAWPPPAPIHHSYRAGTTSAPWPGIPGPAGTWARWVEEEEEEEEVRQLYMASGAPTASQLEACRILHNRRCEPCMCTHGNGSREAGVSSTPPAGARSAGCHPG